MRTSKKDLSKSEDQRFISDLEQCAKHKDEALRYFATEKLKALNNASSLKSGVKVYKQKETQGALPQKGADISVFYVGYLGNGKIFDSGEIEYTHGIGEVITAWEQALKTIKEGEKATIFAPSVTAYGKRGAGKLIKPFTTLIFDIELKRIS